MSRFVLVLAASCVAVARSGAQDLSQPHERSPARGDDALFVAWSTDLTTPELEIDVPSYGDSIVVEFMLYLQTGRQSWTTRIQPALRTTEVLVPLPPAADRALVDEPAMLTALAWHHNSEGEVIFAHGTDSIPVTLSAGVLSHRLVVPVRIQREINGVLIDFYDRGEVGFVEHVAAPSPLPADESEVDREE